MLPFTGEQFLVVFADYNEAIWPTQIIAILLGAAILAHTIRPSRVGHTIVAGALAVMWGWTGIVYHGMFFSSINLAALAFAVLFIVQAALFCIVAGRRRITFGFDGGAGAWTGALFVAYAAIVYPLIGIWSGHTYPAMPMFGVTPCPVTIFTLGMLLMTTRPCPLWLLAIPFAWSLIGGSAAILLNVPQDWFLLVSGGVATAIIVMRDRRTQSHAISGLSRG